MPIKLVENLSQVLQVRRLRNSCRDQLTNHNEYIGVVGQIAWYFRYYRRARFTQYRLYLLTSEGKPVAYGAARSQGERLLITECVGADHRRRGHGKTILQHLIEIGRAESRELVADIWSNNPVSVALHEKAGFRLQTVSDKSGRELKTYVLAGD